MIPPFIEPIPMVACHTQHIPNLKGYLENKNYIEGKTYSKLKNCLTTYDRRDREDNDITGERKDDKN